MDGTVLCELSGCVKRVYCKGLCKAHYQKHYRYGDARHNGRVQRRKPIEFIEDSNGCFLCISHAKRSDGYISYQFNGKMVPLHRYMYEECFGKVPDGFVVMHKCDVRDCVNPEHLMVGTQADNIRDMIMKGRASWQNSSISTRP